MLALETLILAVTNRFNQCQSAAELLVVRRGSGAAMCLVSGLSQSGALGCVSLQRKRSLKGNIK